MQPSYDAVLRKERPESDVGGATWDRDLGNSFLAIEKTMAWKHMVISMSTFREFCITQMVDGVDGADEWRKAISMLDEVLRVPEARKLTGKNAQQWLNARRSGEGDDVDGD